METDMTRLALVLAFSAVLSAAALPTSKPEDVGFSAKRLEQIAPLVKRHVDAGELSGAVTLVARKGKVVHLEAHGQMDVEGKKPMQTGTLFRMASMTKPVTAVAILMLMEEGKLILADPVSKFIPEFGNAKVAEWNLPNDPRGAGVRLVPPTRPMTLQDLLTHTAGMTVAAEGPAGDYYAALKLAPTATLAERVKAWGTVPLSFQPGTQWQYTGGPGFDTLGRVVEIVSGMTLEEFFERRIFQPLGMRDTFFRVPAGREAEVAASYDVTKGTLTRAAAAPVVPGYFGGGGGLTGSASDYFTFSQMLLNGGSLNGVRILSRKSVELMTDNAIGDLDLRNYISTEHDLKGYGFGLGVRVRKSTGRTGWLGSRGDYGWAGARGTYFWIDPAEQVIGIILMQTRVLRLRTEFPNAVYAALE
jgi:CubicO group peptidase (beta-lactamase class C family)